MWGVIIVPLFRIKHPKTGAKSFLAGTYHVGLENFTRFPKEILDSFNQAKTFICESDLNFEDKKRLELEGQINAMEKAWFAKHRNVSGDDRESRVSTYTSIFEVIWPLVNKGWLPSAWAQKTEQPELNTFAKKIIQGMPTRHIMPHLLPPMTDLDSLDELLIIQAKFLEKKVVFLETQLEALQAFYGIALNLAEQLQLCSNMGKIKKEQQHLLLKRLEELYLTGDLDAMQALAQGLLTSEAGKKYHAHLLDKRDEQFAENMLPYLQEGGAFVAVGALHLKGIAEILLKQGFIVERIQLSERKYPISLEHFVAEILKRDAKALSVYIQDVVQHQSPTFLCSLFDLKDLLKASPERFALLCQAWKAAHPISLFNFLLNNPSLPRCSKDLGEIESLLIFAGMPTRNKAILIKMAEALLLNDKDAIKEQLDRLIGAAKENGSVALWSPLSTQQSPITSGGLNKRLSALNPCYIESINESLGGNWDAYISDKLEPGNMLGRY